MKTGPSEPSAVPLVAKLHESVKRQERIRRIRKFIWTKLNLKVDCGALTGLLDEVRIIRNDVMHFDPDPMTPDERHTEKIRQVHARAPRITPKTGSQNRSPILSR